MYGDMAKSTTPAFTHMVQTFGRIFDQRPDILESVRDFTVNHLKTAPMLATSDPYEHIAEHIKQIIPLICRDTSLDEARQALAEAYARLPATPETRLKEKPGDNSIWVGAAIASGLAVAVAAIVVGYCLGGDAPAPGESVEVRC